ncbi:MAG: aminoglycoside phosphotransferase family protein [bacterium]|nr:aminoglycoside phosphotransferase family protein [bacterium]
MLSTKEKIESIHKTTGLKVNSYKVINKGAESQIIEVNEKWIFRFPRNHILREKMEKRINFLVSFSKVSPLNVPKPKYIEHSFIGYKRMPGTPFYPTNIEKFTNKDRLKIARQLGLFLKALHSYKDRQINFETGYLVMRKNDYRSCPEPISQYLNTDECKNLTARLKTIAKNPGNFEKPTTIIHGDLNFNNILWNPNKKTITGILDWSDMGLGIPAMDFIGLADFNKKTNDQFLKDILTYYDAKNDDLFIQIKENAIIEVMNWFWFYKEKQLTKGLARIVKKLKKVLAQ